MAPLPPPSVLLVSDDPLARAGLSALLSRDLVARVVQECGSDEDLAGVLAQTPFELIVWDLGLDASARNTVWEALSRAPRPTLVLLPAPGDALAALASGARALLPRNASPARLMAALHGMSAGLLVLDPMFSEALQSPSVREVPSSAEADELTLREREVLQLLAEALPNKVIAQRLAISEHTVKFHVNAILTKLGAQSRTDAVVRAARVGLVIL